RSFFGGNEGAVGEAEFFLAGGAEEADGAGAGAPFTTQGDDLAAAVLRMRNDHSLAKDIRRHALYHCFRVAEQFRRGRQWRRLRFGLRRRCWRVLQEVEIIPGGKLRVVAPFKSSAPLVAKMVALRIHAA